MAKKPRQERASKPQAAAKGQDSASGRKMPHNVEAELALLASMAINPDTVAPDAIRRFGQTGAAFYLDAHAGAYEALAGLWTAKQPIDEISLGNRLKEAKRFEAVGGEAFVSEIFNFLPTAANFEAYAKIVSDKFLLRTVITDGTNIVARAYEDDGDSAGLIHDFEQTLFRMTDRISGGVPVQTIYEQVRDYLESLNNPETIFGISTGFPKLDAIVGGLAPQAKIVLAGPISGGKSSFAHNVSLKLALRREGHDPVPVAYFTFEMSAKQTVGRFVQTAAMVNARSVALGKTDAVRTKWFMDAARKVSEAPLFIINERLDMAGIRARIMQLCVKHGLRVAIIDYLQIVPEKKQRGESTTDKLDRMSAESKQIANDTGITIIELSQLTEGEDGKMRTRGSRGITADADQLWILEDNEGRTGWKKLVIAKQRDGDVDDVDFIFHPAITTFFEPTPAQFKEKK